MSEGRGEGGRRTKLDKQTIKRWRRQLRWWYWWWARMQVVGHLRDDFD